MKNVHRCIFVGAELPKNETINEFLNREIGCKPRPIITYMANRFNQAEVLRQFDEDKTLPEGFWIDEYLTKGVWRRRTSPFFMSR